MARSFAAVVVAATASLLLASAASATAPTAVTGAATSIGARSAVVGGRVDPGGEATSWYVEYGSRTAARSAGNGTAPVDVSEQLRSLGTGVTYHYRVVASNGSGTSRGADATLTTRGVPEVVTGAAGALGPSAATLGGTVDPNGRSTGWWVEYGTSSRYGSR